MRRFYQIEQVVKVFGSWSHSVVALGTPLMAASMAYQHKVADLILEGNFFTLIRVLTWPSASKCWFWASLDINCLNDEKHCCQWFTVMPCDNSVNIDAEAMEMAQLSPAKCTVSR